MLLSEIHVSEVVQAKDQFLLHFKCPVCSEKCFGGYPIDTCKACKTNLSESPLEIPRHRSGFRLLAGTERKRSKCVRKKTVRLLLEIQDNMCAYCNISLEQIQYHVDHIIPISFGGTNNLNNLAISCPRCNIIAGAKVFKCLHHKKIYILEKRRRERFIDADRK